MATLPIGFVSEIGVELLGLVRLEEKQLVFEFETRGSFRDFIRKGIEGEPRKGLIDMLQPRIQQVSVPVKEIESVHYEKGFFGTTLTLSCRSMHTLQDIPGSDRSELVLRIEKKHREIAEEFVSRTNMVISEDKLTRMESF